MNLLALFTNGRESSKEKQTILLGKLKGLQIQDQHRKTCEGYISLSHYCLLPPTWLVFSNEALIHKVPIPKLDHVHNNGTMSVLHVMLAQFACVFGCQWQPKVVDNFKNQSPPLSSLLTK